MSGDSPASAETLQIRKLTENDLCAVVQIHCLAFPESALTALGAEAVRRYYHWQLTGPHDVLPIGAFLYGDCVGYSFGGKFRGAMAGFLRRNRLYLIGRIVTHPALLWHSVLRKRLHNGLRRSRPAPVIAAHSTGKVCGILAIAVNPQFQSKGIGQKLMAQTEVWAREQGFAIMRLTVQPDNARAITFYERLGWVRCPLDTAIWNGLMTKSLDAVPSPIESFTESVAR